MRSNQAGSCDPRVERSRGFGAPVGPEAEGQNWKGKRGRLSEKSPPFFF